MRKNGKKKVPRRIPKNKGGGVKAKLKKTKQKQIFFLDGFPYYFYEILAVRDGFKPICSRVRSAAGPRAARESSSRVAGLLAAILPIRVVTALRFLAEFFRI